MKEISACSGYNSLLLLLAIIHNLPASRFQHILLSPLRISHSSRFTQVTFLPPLLYPHPARTTRNLTTNFLPTPKQTKHKTTTTPLLPNKPS